MNCQSFETRLDELLDRRLSPDVDPQLAEHGQHCRRCNRMLADYLALSAAIDSLTSPGAFTDLPARVLAEIAPHEDESLAVRAASASRAVQSGEHTKPYRIPMAAWIAMAVAASLLVAIGAWGWVNSHESARPANSPSIVTHQPASQGPIAMISAEEIETIAGRDPEHISGCCSKRFPTSFGQSRLRFLPYCIPCAAHCREAKRRPGRRSLPKICRSVCSHFEARAPQASIAPVGGFTSHVRFRASVSGGLPIQPEIPPHRYQPSNPFIL